MESTRPTSSPRPTESESGASGPGPTPAFALPYRVIYAVATQDAVLVYDTQQMTPIVVVSNLHFATFTDITWYVTSSPLLMATADQYFRSNDGLTLLMSSSDGFCSNLTFNSGELGQVYTGHVPTAHHPSPAPISTASSAQPTPVPTPTAASAPPSFERQLTPVLAPPASPAAFPPPSPTRSNSTSSMTTQSSQMVNSNPTPTLGSVPSVAATNPSFSNLPWTTPPQTPMSGIISSRPSSVSGSVLGKRDTSESEKEEPPKKRRVAPTLIKTEDPPTGA